MSASPVVHPQWKEQLARLVRWPFFNWLMVLGVRLVVPRHRVGVALAVLDENGRVLLLRHVFHPKAPWGLPGGWLGRNENPPDGALRELYEETGLRAHLEAIIYVSHETPPPQLAIGYLARPEPGSIRLSAEIIEAGWFEPDDLPTPMLRSTRAIIRNAYLRQQGPTPHVQPRLNGRP